MATLDLAKKAGFQPHLDYQKFALTNLIDFSVNEAASADVIQAIEVVEGCIITNVKCIVIVAEGGTLTFDVGVTGDDPNGFDDAVNGNDSVGVITDSASGTDAYATANGKYFSSSDTIDLVLDDAADTAKILVIAEGFYINNATVQSTL